MDTTDQKILRILQGDGRCSNAEIARRLDKAPSAILERVRKLEKRGVLTGYEARINPEALDLALLAFLFVKATDGPCDTETGHHLAKIPEVLEVHQIAGDDCFLLKVRAASTTDLHRILKEEIGGLGTVRSIRSTIVLETLKESTALPMAAQPHEHNTRKTAA